MSDETNGSAAASPVSGESPAPARSEIAGPESKDAAGTNGDVDAQQAPKEVAPSENIGTVAAEENEDADEDTVSNEAAHGKPLVIKDDSDMRSKHSSASHQGISESTEPTASTPVLAKAKGRRKSTGVPEHKTKKLSKRISVAKLTHTDAKAGDYFYIKLKGYPLWPGIVCDESMLPERLIKSRPVTAARSDGTYRSDYEDGGPKVKDRTFPVMFFHTNEFSWVPNTDLVDLDIETVGDTQAPMRKDLQAAHMVAAEKHDLDHFRTILKNFMEARQAELEASEAATAAKKVVKPKRKSKAAHDEDDDGDVEMDDSSALVDAEAADTKSIEKSNKKKRKQPEDSATSQTDSVKKPRPTIKLTNTPKASNGVATPKSVKDPNSTKPAKSPRKKATPKAKETTEAATPKEPELTPEEKRLKKEKEILFLRHKLQKGMLTRDQEPKEEEMKQMSEFVTKLEGYADLEVSIIRGTKINKVLKAILKLNHIPKEDVYQFKPRSQTLLDKWNKLLASEQGTPAAAPTTTNGASPTKYDAEEAKRVPDDASNGITESAKSKDHDASTAMVDEGNSIVDNATAEDEDNIQEKVAEAVEATA